MRLVGVSLMLFGAAIAWYLGVNGEDPATLRAQLFAFFHIQDPGAVLPQAVTPMPLGQVGGSIVGAGTGLLGAIGRAGQAAAGKIAGNVPGSSGLAPPGPRAR